MHLETKIPFAASKPGALVLTLASLCALAQALACGSAGGEPGSSQLGQAVSQDGAIADFTGICVDVRSAGTADGTPVQVWTCNGTAAQRWTYTNGAFVGIAGKCLDVTSANTANGTPVQLWACNGSAAQSWSVHNGQLTSVGGKCLDVNASNPVAGEQLEIWDCNGGSNQQFSFSGSLGASSSGTRIPPASQIVDASGNVWTVSGGVVYENGAAAGFSANVTNLVYEGQTVYQNNDAGGWWSWNGSTWVSASSPVGSSSGGGGGSCPATTGDVTVTTATSTGRTVTPYLYGLSTGSLGDNGFALVTDATVKASLGQLKPTLVRFNANLNLVSADWSNWFTHAPAFTDPNVRLVVGVGPGSNDTSISPADWATRVAAFASRMRNAGHEVSYWEIGNELDGMNVGTYCQYFNAIADALHGVDAAYRVGGTVASWWGGIDIAAFVANTGSRAGFFDFHAYPTGPSDTADQVYAKAASFSDVASVRTALAGSPIADIPIGLLEYNMDGLPGDEPRQATYVGAIYESLLLTQALRSDEGFTMAGLWDAVGDSYYGVVGNEASGYDNSVITAQGYYLGYAGQHMGGAELSASSSLSKLQVLATKSGSQLAIQLVNYDTSTDRTVSVGLDGCLASSVSRWELGKSAGTPAASTLTSLSSVSVPSESIVILTATLQ